MVRSGIMFSAQVSQCEQPGFPEPGLPEEKNQSEKTGYYGFSGKIKLIFMPGEQGNFDKRPHVLGKTKDISRHVMPTGYPEAVNSP
ncbi:MAG: hypothetical protein OEZ59_10510 [Deltaproteobacteria bacterium]|nr:hypothetical protein [Deltaproteobacteria bacterium]